jgi:hypothetical protein
VQILEIQPNSKKAGYFSGGMDARTIARITGIPLGTLNVWSQRGLLPGLQTGVRGKRRDIDVPTATRIAILGEMLRLRVPVEYASRVAATMPLAAAQVRWMFIIPEQADLAVWLYSPDERLSDLIREFEDKGRGPALFAVLDVGQIVDRVREAEREWLQNRRGRQPDG